jgi:RHS repeat-associated protein
VLAAYAYDGLGRRIQETASGITTDLYYDQQGNVLEEDVGGVAKVQYVYSPADGSLIERDRDATGNGQLSERLYAQTDANGDVTALVNAAGQVVERYVYDPYGTVTVLDANWNQRAGSQYAWRYLFQGGRYDPATGYYHFGARDYSPSLGSWLEQDPLGLGAGDPNVYRFVGGNPVNATDPSGLQPPLLLRRHPSCMTCHSRMDASGRVNFSTMSTQELIDVARWLDAESLGAGELRRRADRITAYGPTEFFSGVGEGAAHTATHPWEIVTEPLHVITSKEYACEASAQFTRALFLRPAHFFGSQAGSAVVTLPLTYGGVRVVGLVGRRFPGVSALRTIGTAESPIWSSASGDIVVDSASLPANGVQVPRRLTIAEMEDLSRTHGIEFSLVYETGPGVSGGGGTYWLYSGTPDTVPVPIGSDVRWIYHTHAALMSAPYASAADQAILQALQQQGSPQQSSLIIPVGGTPFRFDVINTRR